MLRFDRTDRRPPNYLARSEQWRVLRLMVALGLVVLLMSQLRGPGAARVLGIFLRDSTESKLDGADQKADVEAPDANDSNSSQESNRSRAIPLGPGFSEATDRQESVVNLAAPGVTRLGDIRDNTQFRSEETAPWFHLLGVLYAASAQDLRSESLGNLTALQLLEQPDAYRGRLVTISGTARQSVPLDPIGFVPSEIEIAGLCMIPEVAFAAMAARSYLSNSFFPNYHRVAIQQPGASVPILVFTLDVPDAFPSGEAVREQVSLTGYFFKNWLYPSGDGLTIGPVVLAKQIAWERPPLTKLAGRQPHSRSIFAVVCIAAAAAPLATWWLWRRSRFSKFVLPRQPVTFSAAPDFSSLQAAPRDGQEAFGNP